MVIHGGCNINLVVHEGCNVKLVVYMDKWRESGSSWKRKANFPLPF
jgi:hypothetical protein